jgi:hypothetical protein
MNSFTLRIASISFVVLCSMHNHLMYAVDMCAHYMHVSAAVEKTLMQLSSQLNGYKGTLSCLLADGKQARIRVTPSALMCTIRLGITKTLKYTYADNVCTGWFIHGLRRIQLRMHAWTQGPTTQTLLLTQHNLLQHHLRTTSSSTCADAPSPVFDATPIVDTHSVTPPAAPVTIVLQPEEVLCIATPHESPIRTSRKTFNLRVDTTPLQPRTRAQLSATEEETPPAPCIRVIPTFLFTKNQASSENRVMPTSPSPNTQSRAEHHSLNDGTGGQ